ncbi:MAG: (Fe-S)-binding protein, partial [Candidatus Gastranaerophilales bacterium]|nr:(Fe-S)-binding protein [Candidatus Gastranaerophilales bacterium]
MDKEIQKKIINCSRCGLCMEVCPVYGVKMTETSALRGKFLQLKGIIEGDLKYDKKIAYNIDLCLGCGKCQKACPSGLNALEIFSAVRNEYQSLFERIFYGSPAFKLKMLALRFLSKFHSSKAKLKLPENSAHFMGCTTCAIQGGKSEFSCCGLPFYIKGRFDLYEKYKKRNLKLFQKYDKIIFDCATCYDTVLGYEGVDK